MKILLTGSNGYAGKLLLPVLVDAQQEQECLVRDPPRLCLPEILQGKVTAAPGDLLKPDTLQLTFTKTKQNLVVSDWKDVLASDFKQLNIMYFVQLTERGVLTDRECLRFGRLPAELFQNTLRTGGERGWHKNDFLWKMRCLQENLAGGVGQQRGRRPASDMQVGDSIDMWRVLAVSHKKRRLMLYAGRKLAGETRLRYRIRRQEAGNYVKQPYAFRPKGPAGR